MLPPFDSKRNLLVRTFDSPGTSLTARGLCPARLAERLSPTSITNIRHRTARSTATEAGQTPALPKRRRAQHQHDTACTTVRHHGPAGCAFVSVQEHHVALGEFREGDDGPVGRRFDLQQSLEPGAAGGLDRLGPAYRDLQVRRRHVTDP